MRGGRRAGVGEGEEERERLERKGERKRGMRGEERERERDLAPSVGGAYTESCVLALRVCVYVCFTA